MQKPVSFLLSAEVARKAIEMVLPSILSMMASGQFDKSQLHIVIMNPATDPGYVLDPSSVILYEETIGEPASWKHPYDEIARAKAFASWRTGLPMDVLSHSMPYLLKADEDQSDTMFGGSATLLGIVVGVSGVQPWFDEMVAYMVAAACRALSIQIMQEKYLTDGERCFLWERKLDSQGSR